MATAPPDSFVKDHLPAPEDWPELLFELEELRYPDHLNAATELLDKAVEEGCGGKTAILSSGGNWTYAELLEKANRLANVLVDVAGLRPGNRVLLHAPNNPLLAASWLAVLKAGGVAVATMPMLRAVELKKVIKKAKISHAVVDARLEPELADAAKSCPELRHVLSFEGSGGAAGELAGLMETASPFFTNVATRGEDAALLAFTSGTTGEPKACVHFHRDIMAMVDTFSRHILCPGPDDIFAGSPPLAFTYGLGGLLILPLAARATTVLDETVGPKMLLEAVEKFRVTTLFTAPTAYRAMLGMIGGFNLKSLKTCVSAGETLPRVISDAWYEATSVRPIDGIGSTEMFHIFISASGADIRPGATGKPVPGYRATILDEAGKTLPVGQVGRLAVKGPTGCQYLDDARQKEYIYNGWNMTGDTYLIDEDGYFWFQARNDDMIVSGGYNIAGPEVEAALGACEKVSECAVIGVPDEARGKLVKAFVVLREGIRPGDDLVRELQDFVKATIAPYKYPRAIAFIDALPKTQTGKIQRFKLREKEMSK